MNKLKNWISNRLPIIQGIILILFFIISLIAGLNEWQNALMISLLLFIGCEFFLLIIGYLEQIMQYIRNVEKTQLTTSEDVDIKHYIKSAKYDIFISGSSLSCLSSVYRTLKELNPIIKLELCNLDKEYMASHSDLFSVINASKEQFDSRYLTFETDVLCHVKNRPKTNIYSINAVSPITYIGVDLEHPSPNSIIVGMHYTFGNDYDLAWIAKPGSVLFQRYKTQIEEIRNKPHTIVYKSEDF